MDNSDFKYNMEYIENNLKGNREYSTSSKDVTDYEYNKYNLRIEHIYEDNVEMWVSTIDPKDNVELGDILKFGFANDVYDKNRETLFLFAKKHDAVLAINGSGFYKDGTLIGKVMQNGITYKEASNGKAVSTLCIDWNGKMTIEDSSTPYPTLIRKGVKHALSFGPWLVKNGIGVTPKDINVSLQELHPRTAIGQKKDGSYVVVVVDGRSKRSIGMDPFKLSKLFLEHDCEVAMMLDGGGSTSLYFDGRILNKPSDGRLRPIVNFIYFTN
jgi:exopolysaccharide biosynthesis protein